MLYTEYHFEYLRKMREVYKKWDGTAVSPYHFDHAAAFPDSPAESNMWTEVRMRGLPFYYQFPIGKYYVDLCDPHHGLVVEIDGRFHEDQKEKDKVREDYIRSLGFRILRIEGKDTYTRQEEDENGNLYKTCKGGDILEDEYIDPWSRAKPQMPWGLFSVWKRSLGVEPDFVAYTLAGERERKIEQIINESEGFLGPEQMQKIGELYDLGKTP